MKCWTVVLVNLLSVVLALVVVWVYARESFGVVGFFFGGLFCLGGGEVGFAGERGVICVSLLDPSRFYLVPNRLLIGGL
jgi:hypothetical protein